MNRRRPCCRAPGNVTALFAFNDIAAIGAIRALHEAGIQVPNDVSVVGFDDVGSAPFRIPSLTTIRQPLREMGKVAAESLLKRINNPKARISQPSGDATGTGDTGIHREGHFPAPPSDESAEKTLKLAFAPKLPLCGK